MTPDALIIPARSIGRTRIDEPYDSVSARLGRPDSSDAAMGKMMATWYAGHNPKGHRTAIFFSRNMGNEETSRVRQIRVTSPWFRTNRDLGVGSGTAVISAQFPLRQLATYEEGGRTFRTMDSGEGILFELDDAGTCVGVIVQRPGDGQTYLPFH